MIIVYVAHPIGGDVKGNMARVEEHCGRIFEVSPEIIPIAPYLMALKFLNDANPNDRLRGVLMNKEFFSRRLIDEVWLFGPKISSGMWDEVLWARQYGIPVVPMSARLVKELALRELKEGNVIQIGCDGPGNGRVLGRLINFLPKEEGVRVQVLHHSKQELLKWDIPWCDVVRLMPHGVPLVSERRMAG